MHRPALQKLRLLAGLAAALLVTGTTAGAAGSVEDGKSKAATCAACHGADGTSPNPEWPSLAGQHAKYTERQLKAFKDGDRANVLMQGQVMALSEQDMADLAAFYAAQPVPRLTANPKLVARGERLYRGGDRDRGISACIACHGPTGRGNPAAGYPVVAGQHATYNIAQLEAYASGARKSDSPQQMMRNIASLLSDEDIAAVASYMQGLR